MHIIMLSLQNTKSSNAHKAYLYKPDLSQYLPVFSVENNARDVNDHFMLGSGQTNKQTMLSGHINQGCKNFSTRFKSWAVFREALNGWGAGSRVQTPTALRIYPYLRTKYQYFVVPLLFSQDFGYYFSIFYLLYWFFFLKELLSRSWGFWSPGYGVAETHFKFSWN